MSENKITENKITRGGSLSRLYAGANIKPRIDDLEKDQEVTQVVQLELLQAGKYQPRKSFDDERLNELAESIKSQGIIQPIIVRKIDNAKFEIIAGERRWRASKIAGLKTIPAIVRELDDKTALAIGLVENLQREDLKPMDEAEALQQLKNEFKLKDIEIAELIGKSKSEVSRLFGLLKLPACLKALYERGVNSSSILDDLKRAYKKHPKETEDFIKDKNSITRGEIQEFINSKEEKIPPVGFSETQEPELSTEKEPVDSEIKTQDQEEESEKIPPVGFSETQEPELSTEKEPTDSEIKTQDQEEESEKIPPVGFSETQEPELSTEKEPTDSEIKTQDQEEESEKIPPVGFSETQEPNDNGEDFTKSLNRQSTGSSETPFIDTVLNDDLLSFLVEYKDEDYYIVMNRKCDDSKFCFIKNNEGDEIRVEVIDLIIVAIK